MSLGDAAEESQEQLSQASCALASGCNLLLLLASTSLGLDREEAAVLRGALNTPGLFLTEADQGWHEQCDASVTYLLKTSMARDPREDSVATVTLEHYPTCDRLMRHLNIFWERIAKGAALIPGKTRQSPAGTNPSQKHKCNKAVGLLSQKEMSIIEEESQKEDERISFDLPQPSTTPKFPPLHQSTPLDSLRGAQGRLTEHSEHMGSMIEEDTMREQSHDVTDFQRVSAASNCIPEDPVSRPPREESPITRPRVQQQPITIEGDDRLARNEQPAPSFQPNGVGLVKEPVARPEQTNSRRSRKPQLDAIADFFDD